MSGALPLPGWRDWAFALKTYAAAMLALFLALWIDLPRPYWAVGTVYITSQVLAGATRSKALYRVLGTLLGAVMAVALVPNLVNAPELLTLAIALWVGLCLYLSLLDRTPRSYLMMLAGYTAALIGFPSVTEPGAIFDTAVARAEEISLGILSAALVSAVVLPQSAVPQIEARLTLWLAQARGWVADVLGRTGAGQDGQARDSQAKRLRLAADAIAFDALATPLRYDAGGPPRSPEAMATLRQHMLMFMPIVSAVADRIAALEQARALTAPLRALLADMAAWIASGTTDPEAAARLRARAADEPLPRRPDWNDLVRASLRARLRDFIDLRQDTRLLQRHIADGRPVSGALAFRYTAAARTIRHRDHGMALLSAIGVVLAIGLTGTIWIATGWPDGAGAPMMAAVGCCFFAAQDDPAPHILGFANSAIVGALVAGFYLFAVLPLATSFEMLALALSPALILAGVLMTQGRTAPIAMGAAVNGFTMLALQGSYTGDFAAFTNSALAVILGMWAAALVTRLVRSVGSGWSARRLRGINRRSLARAAAREGRQNGLELAAIMLDRVGLIAPRLAALPPEDAAWTADLLAEVRVGINLVELRRDRRRLAPAAKAAVERLLEALARHFRAPAARAGDDLLGAVDAALDAALAEPGDPAHRAALMGLVGIRRGLFPAAPPYQPPLPAATEPGLAA
ncbi:FUSC family protein [Methylobacterium dankookense]|uniref:p-hydroxybenzoic acid efflux pump subunit AaeB n=1 Tax=Methylobacterium dankookense TaxID=560405 RepID=A0A564FX17_9HYPH|nr:FUSC family protein [Methylobacterium dankookense]GJD55375.1 p-hydroxybenzoic acid efflux pump subunit AaeB [Methylobacterium dankookense]VUF12250.1 p-hydroxybenzoic acid efflux pump subunit AaeB [Methylobacterium dankookense]